MGLLSVSHEKKTVERYYVKWTLLKNTVKVVGREKAGWRIHGCCGVLN